ncbi:phosphatidylinositol 4-phosphate 3-kinase C2 domain-containing subunit alpha [Tribolium madens]|uniref:phosphatidylinositol 4-phosphate 3-kinase C2 domain-containing subunit alpha n=1 Tax=Tribolium madens TaxID=41895 RepID=UPI001CF735D5|nr:phosphatidylinositol 4-phosphate 3-kinase C2 domain-containing subunit alpha [Tribolium madens]XP_044261896.1 phosphatidylinositol 4-phosphate 3-kinase C2 domain-containing subunit alpha [Tribolium madens]
MSREVNYDRKYQEDLERAQALSLESLALEQFKNKRLQELNSKNVSVSRASSMNATANPRPRPGPSAATSPSTLLAPPPRKTSAHDSPDLISFANPPTTTYPHVGWVTPQMWYRPPALPPKNQHRPPPPRPTVRPHDLINLAHEDTNSVRVSILQEFDPILSSGEYPDLRTVSPDFADDGASVYDDYDPYDIYTGSGNNSMCDPVYAKTAPQSPPPLPPRGYLTDKLNLLDGIVRVGEKNAQRDSDLKGFYNMVKSVRGKYRFNDPDTNMGLVISPMVDYEYKDGTSIKLCVYPDFEGADINKPINFTCDVNCSIEHVTLQLTCDLDAPSKDKYTLKVWGCNEYLVPTTFLSDYEYVHNCIKLEEDILLTLIPDSKVDKSFARTLQDDNRDRDLTYEDVIPNDSTIHLTYDNLVILLETVENEMRKLEEAALQIEKCNSPLTMPALQPLKVIQSAKCVINLMGNLSTLDLTSAVDDLQRITTSRPLQSPFNDAISSTCNRIRLAIQNLIEMYSQAFKVDFEVKKNVTNEPVKYVSDIMESLVIRVCAIYRPNVEWKHDSFMVAAQIYHGTRPMGHPVLSQPCVKTEGDHRWPARIIIDHWFDMMDVPISALARESRLKLVIYGRTIEPSDDAQNEPKYNQEEIGWASVQFFTYDGTMVQGNVILSIWPPDSQFLHGAPPAFGTHPTPDHPMMDIQIAGGQPKTEFPKVPPDLIRNVVKGDFQSLDRSTQQQLVDICEQDMLCKLPPQLREVLWEKRHYLYHIPQALPKVLLAAHSWEYAFLPDLHGMLYAWQPLPPIQALQLLLPTFPDLEVRKMAIRWINGLTNDELVDFLPQLVVALRHETYENSPLAQFLLDRSLRSPRLAHHLFWLLSHALPGSNPQNFTPELCDEITVAEVRHHRRMKLMLRALLAICGDSLRNCFLSQQLLVKDLNDLAETVKKTKESQRTQVLYNRLRLVDANLADNPTSLPLSPTLRVTGVEIKSCFYFPSNTLPLKISFVDGRGTVIPAIYKVGDDLQQDMLTLQMVRLMDKLWLNKGLDLKMVAFVCVPTGKKKGMIEMVTKAETLRKIQVEHGLTGSFKDKPIAEWLAKHNPSELEYQRAVENFTASCAGYCVVTYILGICDRHNDNIMLKTSGHLFHIDFGKFLGDAQMFGNFKRDRAPFVLTSDMAYVINGGDRPSEKFHKFVDLCCQAFNIIRDNANLFLYLFTLMASSGICGMTPESVIYLHKALLPHMSNPEAAAYFARLIESSLKSWFTQFNFFLHNLAQMKFGSDHDQGSLLSFVPKRYSMATDGKLVHVQVVSYKKRYDPDKYYVYVLRVTREGDKSDMEIHRTYKEFCELHQKLCIYFPLAKLHSLTTGLHVGRSNIKQVAEKRYQEVSSFITSLFKCADEIAHSDLVYTFFHPLLRDQKSPEDYARKKDRKSSRNQVGRLKGQLKLSFQFSKGVFRVMVYHVRDLPLLTNGQEPSTYVKVYLRPDTCKETKRKTKVVKKNCHPSFVEMLEYRMAFEVIREKSLQATVWNYDALQENEYLGGVELQLSNFDLTKETIEWYPLVNLSR